MRRPPLTTTHADELLHPLLQWDLLLVERLVRARAETPWLQRLMTATTSRHRTHDVSIAIWCTFVVMTPEFGWPFFWTGVANALVVLLLQWGIGASRPIDVSAEIYRLQERSCIDNDTKAFPCVDCHMAVVVLLPTALNARSILAQSLFIVLALYISLTRVLLGSRFITQVVSSWCTGLAGVLIGNHGHTVVKAQRLSRGYNTAAVVLLVAMVLFVLGSWIENNESRLIGVPKKDYMDVLTNILNAKPALQKTTASVKTSAVEQLPETSKANNATGSKEVTEDEEQLLMGKRDSFYFLVRAMRSRAQMAGGASAGLGGGQRVADFSTHDFRHARKDRTLANPNIEADREVRGQRGNSRANR